MAKAKSSNLTTEVIPSSSVGNQQVSISLKIGNVDASDLLVVDPTALDDIKTDLEAEVTKQVSSAKSDILQEVATNDEAHKQEIQQLGATLSSSISTKVETAKNELSSQNSSTISSGLESAKRELQSNVQNAVDQKVTDKVTTAKEEIKQEAEQSINTKVQDAKRELEQSTSQLVTQEVNASKTEIKQEISSSTEQSIQTAKTELNRSIAENTNKIGDLSATGLPAEKQGNVGLGLQYLKEKYEEVKSTHDQNAQEVNAKIEELSNKVEQNSNPIKYVGILSETKDTIEAKGPDKGTWLDSQIRVLNSKLKPADGMILETSDHYVYARKGGGWILHTDKPVDLATNATAGIVQGKDVEGSGYIKVDGSGNMKLVDYQTLKDDIALRKTENTNLSNKLDRKTGDFSSLNLSGSDNGKPLSVVEIANAILGIIGDLANVTGSQPSTIVEALNGIIASKEQINQTITGLMPKSGGTFTGKVAMDTSIMSYGDNELIPLKELKRIVGDFSTVDVNTKSTVTEVLKSLKTLITDNTNTLNNKLNTSGGTLTGKITSDGNQSGFVDNDYVPLKEIKRLLGDYESLSVSNHGSVTEVLQSLLNLINTNTSSIRGNSDKIGDLSTTGLDAQHQSTVAAGIKNLKDTLTALDGRESSHNSNITSRLDSMDERINANSTQVRYVGDLTVDKDTVEAKGGSKDSWLDSQVPVLKPGQTAMDGDFVNTSDGHAYYRKGTTWVLKLNNPIVPGTNTTAGIIKGKDEAGHGYIKSTGLGDGTFELVDYQDILDAIRDKVGTRDFNSYKQEVNGKLGDLTNINLTGAHATVVESFNTIIDLIGSVSSITGVTNTSVVTAIRDLVTNLENVKNTADGAMPKSGGEITGKITCENSLNNFTGRELVPAEFVTGLIGDLSTLTTTDKDTVVAALLEMLGNMVTNNSDNTITGTITTNGGLTVEKANPSIILRDNVGNKSIIIETIDNGENVKISSDGSVEINAKLRYVWNVDYTVTEPNEIPSLKQCNDSYFPKNTGTDMQTKLTKIYNKLKPTGFLKDTMLNIGASEFVAGPVTAGVIDVPDYDLKFYNGATETADYPAATGSGDSKFGVEAGEMWIGNSAGTCIAWKLTNSPLRTDEEWTILIKMHSKSDYRQWKQLFFLNNADDNADDGNHVKGSSSIKCFRAEVSTAGSSGTLMAYSGSGDNGKVFTNEGEIGTYTNDEDIDVVITCSGGIIKIIGKSVFTATMVDNSIIEFKHLGFSGRCCNAVIKEIKIFRDFAASGPTDPGLTI